MSQQNSTNPIDGIPEPGKCRGIDLVALEERVLYSAAPISTDALQDFEPVEMAVDALDVADSMVTQLEIIDLVLEELPTESVGEFQLIPPLEDLSATELLVVDRSVTDYERLVNDLVANEPGRFDIRYLDSNSNGINAISTFLSELGRVDAIHLISHGSDGHLYLGGSTLNLENLEQYRETLADWSRHAQGDTDLLIYGCNVAESAVGEEFVEAIADVTGFDVSASDDATGHELWGGDWDFEFQVGTVDSTVAFSIEVTQSWEQHLALLGGAPSTVTTDAGDSINQNTHADGRGNQQSVAMNAEGDTVIVWSEDGTDGSGWGVFAQRYDENGDAIGSLIAVNDTTAGNQQWASVAIDEDGEFVIVWTDRLQQTVNYKQYFADGTEKGGEQAVNVPAVSGAAIDANIGMNSAGDFVITWVAEGTGDGKEIYASLFDSDGALVRDNFLVNTTVSGDQLSPSIDINEAGNFVISWHDDDGVYAQRFSSDGSANGGEIDVAQNFNIVVVVKTNSFSSVAIQEDNSFAIATTATINGGDGLELRLYDSDGAHVGTEGVNQSTSGTQKEASIQVDSDGNYLVTWEGVGSQAGQEDSYGAYFRLFEADGDALNDETLINFANTAGSQNNVSGAIVDLNHMSFVYSGQGADDSQGVFFVTFQNDPPTGSDESITSYTGGAHVFEVSDFTYSDPNGDPFDGIQIDRLPTTGVLLLNGSVVNEGDYITQAEILSGDFRYAPAPGFLGLDQFAFFVSDGSMLSESAYTMDITVESQAGFWFSTEGGESGGPDELTNWQDGDIIQFGGDDFELGSTTVADGLQSRGELALRASLAAYNLDVDALHHVHSTITIAPLSATPITLNAGDLIFSIDSDGEDFGGLTNIDKEDILVFKPTIGDYSVGTFHMLIDMSSALMTDPDFEHNDTEGITLVEQDVTLGDVNLFAGDLLFTQRGGGTHNNIYRMVVSATGEGTSQATADLLIDGGDINLSHDIVGIDIADEAIALGGQVYAAGTLFVTLDQSDTIGDNSLSIEQGDVAALSVVTTSQLGDANVTAELAFDISDTNAPVNGSNTGVIPDGHVLDAFTIYNDSRILPVSNDHAVTIDEDTAYVFEMADFSYFDGNGDPIAAIEIVSTGSGQLFYEGQVVTEGTILDPAQVALGKLVYLPAHNSDVQDSFEFRVSDGELWSAETYEMSVNIDAVVDQVDISAGDVLAALDGASLVNETTLGEQSNHRIAALSDGGYVVVWQSEDRDMSDGDDGIKIYLQRYDSNGEKIGGESRVDADLAGDQSDPDVIALQDGGFLILWSQEDTYQEIYAQRYDVNGDRITLDGTVSANNSEFLVAQHTQFDQLAPTAASLADGGFVVAWTTYNSTVDSDGGVSARIFDANGNSSDEFRINDTVAGVQRDVKLVALPDNGFAATWVDQSVNSFDVKMKVFSAGDTSGSTEITLNDTTRNRQTDPQLTLLDDQTILATWEAGSAIDGSGKGIMGRRFDLQGNAIDRADQIINLDTHSHQRNHSIVASGNGGFIAFWESVLGDDDGAGILGARYDSNFDSVGNAFLVNTHTYGDQFNPESAVLADGTVVVLWDSADGGEATNEFSTGIFHDRFVAAVGGAEDTDIDLSFEVGVSDTDGSESIQSVVISSLPVGFSLTDGLNTFVSSAGNTSVDVASWDLDNLAVTPTSQWHGTAIVDISATVNDGVDTQTWSKSLAIFVTAVDDAVQVDDLQESGDEDTITNVSSAVLAGAITDHDSGIIAAPSTTPDVSYRLSPDSPPTVLGNDLIWSDSGGVPGLDFYFDARQASFVSSPRTNYPGIEGAIHLDGSGGGVTDTLLPLAGGTSTFELWFKPSTSLQSSVLFEFGDSTFGAGVYLSKGQLEFHFYDQQDVDGNFNDPWIIAVDDYSTIDFNQVMIIVDSADGSGGDTGDPDLYLYLNGQLVSTLADIPFDWTGESSTLSVGQPNGFDYGGIATFGNYEGQVAELNYFNQALSATEVQAHYNEVTYRSPQLSEIDGQTAVYDTTYVLDSGALLTFNADGSFDYDPNGQYEHLQVGDTVYETVELTFWDTGGQTTSNLTFEINGVNDDPTLADETASVVENASLNTVIVDMDAFDIDDSSFSYSIVSGNSGGVFGIDTDTGEIYVASMLDFETQSAYRLEIQVQDAQGGTDTAFVDITIDDYVGSMISGSIYEDLVGDGSIVSDPTISGVTVYLYLDDGDGAPDNDDTLVATATTNASGLYQFSELVDGNYFVVVDSRTIAPNAGFNAGYGLGDVWAEQTFASHGALVYNSAFGYIGQIGSSSRFGGAFNDGSDDASSLETSSHLNRIYISGADTTQVDFGFSFNVVTNMLGGDAQDDDAGSHRTVQGSLRQFIQNANAIAGGNEMRFVPVVQSNESNVDGNWWQLSVTNPLDRIVDDGTVIDGSAWFTDGMTRLESNGNSLGAHGSTIGVGPDGRPLSGDESTFTFANAPELELVGNGVLYGLVLEASDTTIRDVAIYGFGGAGSTGANILVDGSSSNISNVSIEDNVIGASAGSFSDLSLPASLEFHNILVLQADQGTIANNLIGFAASHGVVLEGKSDLTDGANQWDISNNEIRSNGLQNDTGDGIEILYGSGANLIQNNLIVDNAGLGIDTWYSSGSNRIVDNTIQGNGWGGVETGGVRLFGTDNLVQQNLIENNTGPGVHVIGANTDGTVFFSASTGNLISQNSFTGNSGLAIDLSSPAPDTTTIRTGDGVSINGIVSDLNAGNLGLDYPTINLASVRDGDLYLEGYVDPLLNIDRLEIYAAVQDLGDFAGGQYYGEGSVYLGTIELTAGIYNSVTGLFTSPLVVPGSGLPTSVTAIAIDVDGNTSEFSVNSQVNVPPVAVDSEVQVDENGTYTFSGADFDFLDVDLDTNQAIRIDSLPLNGTLLFSGSPVNIGDVVDISDIQSGLLTYSPPSDSYGNDFDTFEFSVSDGTEFSLESATMTIDVEMVNQAPQAVDDSYETDEDQVLEITDPSQGLLANDWDREGDELVVNTTPVNGPAHGSLTINADGTFTYEPDNDFFGLDSFEYEVTDGTGTRTAIVTITVQPVNDAPTIHAPATVSVDENTTDVTTVAGSDIDSATIAFGISGSGEDDHLFEIDPATGELRFKNAPNFEFPGDHDGDNRYEVMVAAYDGDGGVSTHVIYVQVADVADSPDAVNDNGSVKEGGTYVSPTGHLLANDVDGFGTGLTASLASGPQHGTVSVAADGSFVYVHDGSETTSDFFVYEITAGDGQTDTARIVIDVTPVQDATVAKDDYLIATESQFTIANSQLLANDSDPDSTRFTIHVIDGPQAGQLVVDGKGNLVYITDPLSRMTQVSFTYVVEADGLFSNEATVYVETVSSVNNNSPSQDPDPDPPADDGSDDDPSNDEPASDENDEEVGGNNQNNEQEQESAPQPGASQPGAINLADTEDAESDGLEFQNVQSFFSGDNQGSSYVSEVNPITNVSLTRSVAYGVQSAIALSTFDPVSLSVFWHDLDSAKNEFLVQFDFSTPKIAYAATSFLTVGYVAWIIRGGVLLTAYMAKNTVMSFDPLVLIESSPFGEVEDDESIADLVDQ